MDNFFHVHFIHFIIMFWWIADAVVIIVMYETGWSVWSALGLWKLCDIIVLSLYFFRYRYKMYWAWRMTRLHPIVKRRKDFSRHKFVLGKFQGDYCWGCISPLTEACEMDHYRSLEENGIDELDNIHLLCSSCHAKKTRHIS